MGRGVAKASSGLGSERPGPELGQRRRTGKVVQQMPIDVQQGPAFAEIADHMAVQSCRITLGINFAPAGTGGAFAVASASSSFCSWKRVRSAFHSSARNGGRSRRCSPHPSTPSAYGRLERLERGIAGRDRGFQEDAREDGPSGSPWPAPRADRRAASCARHHVEQARPVHRAAARRQLLEGLHCFHEGMSAPRQAPRWPAPLPRRGRRRRAHRCAR